MSEYPPGTIALPVGDLGRQHAFTLSLACLRYPEGTGIHMVQSISVAANLNTIIRDMPPHSEWLFIQADDQVFPSDILYRLLDRQVDVVVPLITRRHPPFSTLVFKTETEEGYLPYAYDELPAKGLITCHAAGSGGMLIRRHVLERIVEWQGHDRVFEFTAGDVVNEDVEFCRKLRSLDPPVPIHCDVEVVMGHCGGFIVFPHYAGENGSGKWGLRFQMGEGPEGAIRGIFLEPDERTPEETLLHARREAG